MQANNIKPVAGEPASVRVCRTLRRYGALIGLVFVAGCAGVGTPPPTAQDAVAAAPGSCADWFAQLDATVDHAGVRDGGAYRIPGFPYLRVDRFLASYREQAGGHPHAFEAWMARMRELDATARSYEIRNLPSRDFPLAGAADKAVATEKTGKCGMQSLRDDLGSANRRDLLVARASVPDSYSNFARALFYPFARIPFEKGVDKWHQEAADMFGKTAAETAVPAGVKRYTPAGQPVSARRIADIFSHVTVDALGVPQFSGADRDLLFDAYAPAFEIESSGEYDRFGPLAWRQGVAPDVNVAQPVAYRRMAFTRYFDKTLVQLVYTIWFPERPSEGANDLLAGRLDGVVFRVTLGIDGAPLVYDTMHPCGCYHMFFPTAAVKLLPAQKPTIEWAFVPQTLAVHAAAQRIAVRIATRTHYVTGVHANVAGTGIPYRFAEDDELRALPVADQITRSAFGADGIVPGTERAERFYFWPMGIDNSGAMRQWGHHATAFIGRRHFDDANLIERRFEILPRAPVSAAGPD